MPKKQISPSMMCVNLAKLSETLDAFERAGIEYLHIDVMDGEFVPNLQIGCDYIKQFRRLSKIPLDVHLMINRPEDKLDWFDFKPGEYVSVHFESTNHPQRALAKLRDKGCKTMLALNPATPLESLDYLLPDLDAVLLMTVNPGFAGQKLIPQTLGKISRLRKYLGERGFGSIEIEVDGNVSFENAELMSRAGADIFVAGSSSVFTAEMGLEDAIARLRKVIT